MVESNLLWLITWSDYECCIPTVAFTDEVSARECQKNLNDESGTHEFGLETIQLNPPKDSWNRKALWVGYKFYGYGERQSK